MAKGGYGSITYCHNKKEMDRYQVKEGIEVTTFGEEQIVFNPAKNAIHVLNQTSVEILSFLKEPMSAEEIGLLLQEKYGMVEGLNEDVINMVNEFVENDIVGIVG